MNETEQLQKDLQALLPTLKRVTKQLRESEDKWRPQWMNADSNYLRDSWNQIEDHLSKAAFDIFRISSPIGEEGILTKNSSGRYQLPSGEYFTSGSGIEVLIDKSEDKEDHYWAYSRIEHNGNDYYLTKFPEYPLLGMCARVREGSMSW